MFKYLLLEPDMVIEKNDEQWYEYEGKWAKVNLFFIGSVSVKTIIIRRPIQIEINKVEKEMNQYDEEMFGDCIHLCGCIIEGLKFLIEDIQIPIRAKNNTEI